MNLSISPETKNALRGLVWGNRETEAAYRAPLVATEREALRKGISPEDIEKTKFAYRDSGAVLQAEQLRKLIDGHITPPEGPDYLNNASNEAINPFATIVDDLEDESDNAV